MPFQVFIFPKRNFKKEKGKRKGSSFVFQELASAAFLVGDQTACLKVSSKFSVDSACTLCASKTDLVTSVSFTIKG